MSKIKITGPWDMQKIESYLSTCVVPLKLAIISARGWPVIVSLWFFYEHGVIICASKEKSKVLALVGICHHWTLAERNGRFILDGRISFCGSACPSVGKRMPSSKVPSKTCVTTSG